MLTNNGISTAFCLATLLCTSALTPPGWAATDNGERPYSPYVDQTFPRNLYWGDTHVHSRRSMDAYTMGNVNVAPDVAYRFARGETVTANSGQQFRLGQPLDFILLSDHAMWLGLLPLIGSGDERALNTGPGRRWARHFAEGDILPIMMDLMQINMAEDTPAVAARMGMQQDRELLTSVWREVTAMADSYNDPGRFTAFIGYEWTPMPNGDNLHRNVLFRDGAGLANRETPFSSLDSPDVEDLWRHLTDYEARTGGRVLAIPHNANGSNGAMFADRNFRGEPLTPDYARERARWEPLVEVTQIKGDGEAHPFLSPDDPFADFETWDQGNFGMNIVPKENRMLEHEYARGALKLGLELERQLGRNPFKFGMLGSSDTHTSLAAVEEDNFIGKFSTDEPARGRMTRAMKSVPSSVYAASGYMGVWARENTRESLFDAMERREVYATTGPRIRVRFFGGWNFESSDHLRPDYAAIGYRSGVPMGGDLPPGGKGAAPRFLIVAGKDPRGANLERVQLVKGWLGKDGSAREKVYDVALSGGRKPAPGGAIVPALASTVKVADATYLNSVGEPQLGAVWQDPDFDPASSAFYYVRVLEIATPRWTTYDAARYGEDLPDNVPAEIRERAYTSPIWYSPQP